MNASEMSLSLSLSLCLANPVVAQQVVPASIEMAGWHFLATEHDGAVNDVLAFRVPSTETHQILAVRATRTTEAAPWSLDGWSQTDHATVLGSWEALAGVAASSAIDVLGWDSALLDPQAAADVYTAPVVPAAIIFGVYAGSPLEPLVINASDPQAVVELLEGEGFEAVASISVGDTAIDASIDCEAVSAVSLFDIVAFAFASEAAVPETLDDAFAAASSAWCFCIPKYFRFPGTWSPWACTGGPTITGGGGVGSCKYTGCTRTRTDTEVWVNLNCTTTTVLVPKTEGPQPVFIPLPASGICPALP